MLCGRGALLRGFIVLNRIFIGATEGFDLYCVYIHLICNVFLRVAPLRRVTFDRRLNSNQKVLPLHWPSLRSGSLIPSPLRGSRRTGIHALQR